MLPAVEFESVLHPAFEEDEIQLIALGGVLGAAVGLRKSSPSLDRPGNAPSHSLALGKYITGTQLVVRC